MIISLNDQGKLISERREDEDLNSACFEWMYNWRTEPTHTIVCIGELHEQLLPTKLYYARKTQTRENPDETCRLCDKAQESVVHVLSGCSELAQTKYLERHNAAALKILFFELPIDQQSIETIPPWYSLIQPKPVYENGAILGCTSVRPPHRSARQQSRRENHRQAEQDDFYAGDELLSLGRISAGKGRREKAQVRSPPYAGNSRSNTRGTR